MAQVLSTSIPQDVINEIIDHLQDDTTTLKTCSLASRTTYEPTRKHLFATVTLDRPGIGLSLNEILMQNPRLSAHIHTMEIPRLSENIIRTIVPLLPVLSQTRSLVLGMRFHMRDVRFPTQETFSLLSDVLHLPLLDALEILTIYPFPASHLHIAQGLKSLTINGASISKIDSSQAMVRPLLHLRSLYLHGVSVWSRTPDPMLDLLPILDAPNLRQVVIERPDISVQPIIRVGAQSIQTVIWIHYVHDNYRIIDLGVLRDLRRLCFVLRGGYEDNPYSRATWEPISRLLHTGVVAQTLEELSFAFEQGHNLVRIPSLSLGGRGDIWTGLADKRQFPRMAKVSLNLVNEALDSSMLSVDEFRSIVAQKLPLLEEMGLLHTMVSNDWRDVFLS